MKRCPHCAKELADELAFCPYDGSPLAGRRDPMLGVVIDGRYRITGKVGVGGMATVYQAQHSTLGRDVAVKILHPAIANDDALIARFAREARAATRIDHENVVYVLDFGCSDQGFFYLVMEHVAGVPLEEVVSKQAPLEVGRVVHVLAQIAAGIGRAHALGIVHRDLKPDNIMLSTRGNDRDFVKILDFGLSKAVGSETDSDALSLTRVGEVFGTPKFMAPEQWQGQEVSPATDIYALGLIGFEMCAGKSPFNGSTLIALMAQHLEHAPAPPSAVVAPGVHVPPALDDLLLRCLKKDPSERPQSTDEVLQLLGRAWKDARPPVHHTTYVSTGAAPPAPSLDSLPDPTAYQSSALDVTWATPDLCEELSRLHGLRSRKLGELAEALWGGVPPQELAPTLDAIEELEGQVARCGEEVALLRAEAEDAGRESREREARLRSAIIDANLELTVERERIAVDVTELPAEDLEGPLGDLVDTVPGVDDGPSGPATLEDPLGARARLRLAERRLATVYRERQQRELELQSAMESALHRLSHLETELAPLYEALTGAIHNAARRRRELRKHVVEYGKLDGMIASYQGLLAATDV